MKSFIHSLYQTLFSKTLRNPGRPGWLDGLSLTAFLQRAYGKSTRRKNPRKGSPLASLGLHLPQVELLECRITPATFTVTNLLNTGTGSLREAIGFANNEIAHPGADTIMFAPALSGAIDLTTAGDTTYGPTAFGITSDVTIDGITGGGSITLQRDASVSNLRLFRVDLVASLTLDGLTVKDFNFTGFKGGDSGNGGGGAGQSSARAT